MEIKKNKRLNFAKLKKKNIKCPSCKSNSKDPHTPFCSKKCSDIDLFKWLSNERYIDLNN